MAVSTRMIAILSAGVAASGLAAMLALSFVRPDDPFAPCRSSVVSGGPAAIGGPFSLMNEDGKAVTDKDVLSGPSLVYFGYTFCPDVCPLDTTRNAEAVDILEARGLSVTPVFISVDPERDTPPVLKEWTDAIHPRMIGLTGTPEEIRATTQAYRTLYRVPDDRSDPYYLVDHMTHTYLMLPGIGFAEFFARDVPADTMAETIACFIENAR